MWSLRKIYKLCLLFVLSGCASTTNVYQPPIDKELVKVVFERATHEGSFYFSTYTNSDECYGFKEVLPLRGNELIKSTMFAADEEIALGIGYLSNVGHTKFGGNPIIKFNTMSGHEYTVKVRSDDKAIYWKVLKRSIGGDDTPVQVRRYRNTIPSGIPGKHCAGNIVMIAGEN